MLIFSISFPLEQEELFLLLIITALSNSNLTLSSANAFTTLVKADVQFLTLFSAISSGDFTSEISTSLSDNYSRVISIIYKMN